MINMATVAGRIDALDGWSADEFDNDSGHYVVATKNWEGWQAIVLPSGEVVEYSMPDDLMSWLPVLQIVTEAMSHE